MFSNAARVYPLVGLFCGYAIVILFNPIRLALRDGLRCIVRFKRVWLTFALLGFAYSIFQIATFTPLQSGSVFDLLPGSIESWQWPAITDLWRDLPLPTLEGVAGIFDNATTTYPLSFVAAVMLLFNWRGLHGSLFRALRKRYKFWSFPIYFVLLLGTLAALLKPIVFWRLPEWGGENSAARLLQISATVDAVAFIFEYLFGVYIQVYLITVCLAWVKGLSFEEGALFKFAMRRFSYVLKWAGLMILVSTLIVRLPLLLAYFREIPNVLDYLPIERAFMSGLIVLFGSVQISLALHNESLREAIQAHRKFIRRNSSRFGWFLLICALHFFILILADAMMRGAIGDRIALLLGWKFIYACARGLITGWLLASWVCLYRQCESGRLEQESWIRY